MLSWIVSLISFPIMKNMSEITNLIVTVILCLAIIIGWQVVANHYNTKNTQYSSDDDVVEAEEYIFQSKEDVISSTSAIRVSIDNDKLRGSILLKGARLDDLILKNYHVSTDNNSQNVTLLSPTETEESYFAEFGWIDPSNSIKVPDKNTIWIANKNSITDNDIVTLTWNNENGLVFKIKIHLDDGYMFKIDQEIDNKTNSEIKLIPYGRINRSHDLSSSPWVSHEGAVGVINEQLKEWKYKKLINTQTIKSEHTHNKSSLKNWIGFADKYWVTALIPQSHVNSKVIFHAKYANNTNNLSRFQVDFSQHNQVVKPYSLCETTHYFFAGAKELKLLDHYVEKLGISLFDKAVDFGILYFMTKPLLMLLEYFYQIIQNFGLSIIVLTILMKVVTLPLSNKSQVSVLKLKRLNPQILKIKQLYKDDRMKMSKELSSLFKKHDTNPLSGVLPGLIQIPISFTLYKVLFVTIEMRHAPFFLWIKDLSAPDSANLLNLFGILKFNIGICIGILPIILGLLMIIQQKLNHTPELQEDQMQSTLLKFTPYLFIFLFSSFPAGLVIYWICNNTLTIIQQSLIKIFMRKRLQPTHKTLNEEI